MQIVWNHRLLFSVFEDDSSFWDGDESQGKCLSFRMLRLSTVQPQVRNDIYIQWWIQVFFVVAPIPWHVHLKTWLEGFCGIPLLQVNQDQCLIYLVRHHQTLYIVNSTAKVWYILSKNCSEIVWQQNSHGWLHSRLRWAPFEGPNAPIKVPDLETSGGSRISRRGGVDLVGGGVDSRGSLRFKNFVCQNERIGTLKGGASAGRAP